MHGVMALSGETAQKHMFDSVLAAHISFKLTLYFIGYF